MSERVPVTSRELYNSMVALLRHHGEYQNDAFYYRGLHGADITDYSSNWYEPPAMNKEDHARYLRDGIAWIAINAQDGGRSYSLLQPSRVGRNGSFILTDTGVDPTRQDIVLFGLSPPEALPNLVEDPRLLEMYSLAIDLNRRP